MNNKYILPLLVGVGIVSYYLYRKNQKEKAKNQTPEKIVSVATEKVKQNFTPAFKMQYDIIMPPVQASKAVKEAAYQMQDDRKLTEEYILANKKPVYL